MDDDHRTKRRTGSQLCSAPRAGCREGKKANRSDQIITPFSHSMATIVAAPPTTIIRKRRFSGDAVAYGFTFLFAFSILAITVLLVWQLWIHSSPAKEKF